MSNRASDPGARLETERLVLERVGVARARAIVAGDLSGVRAGEGWPHADTVAGLRAFAVQALRDEDTGWLITLRTDGTVIGDCGWKGPPDADGAIEIGYGIAAPYRGRGYATEAVRALVDWSFAASSCDQVTAEVETGNEPSRRLLDRLGFTVARVRGAYVDYARGRLPAAPSAN